MNTLEKIYHCSRLTLAFIFFYHGVVPKLLWLSPGEVEIISAMKLSLSTEFVAQAGALLDILIALMLVFFSRQKWPLILTSLVLILLLFSVAVFIPVKLIAAFNPVSLNVSGVVLCWVALLSLRELQSDQGNDQTSVA